MKLVNQLIVLLFLFAPFLVLAQNKLLHGKVTDSLSGEPIARVSIVQRSVNQRFEGTLSDVNGEYELRLNPAATQLTFSFIGKKSLTVDIDNRRVIDVALASQDALLNDVVVVGYGTQKKANLTGAVSVVTDKELVTTKNENIVNMLAGKVPGLRVQQLSSEPGSYNTKFDIRGMGSPLVVIDGIPRGSGDLSRMDPHEIESVSVLKDASAAIYGVRAANGVILVTTKHGSKNPDGKVDINYSINQTWQQFLNIPKGVDAFDYMMLANEKANSTNFLNFFSPQAPPFSDSLIGLYQNGTLQSTDWVDAIMRNTAPQIQHNLNVNGGTDKLNYFFNFGYMDQGSIFKTNVINYNRYNFRSNVSAKITKRLKASVELSGYIDKKNQPGAGTSVWTILKYAENLLPTDQIYANDNPDYLHLEPDNNNPVALIDPNQVGTSTYINKNFQGQIRLEYQVPGIKGLSAKGMFNYGLNIADNNTVKKAFHLYEYDRENDLYQSFLAASPSTVQRAYYTSTNTLTQFSLDYQRTFNQVHHVGGTLIYEETHSTGDDFWAQREFSLGIPYLFAGDNNSNQLGSMDQGGLYEYVTKSIIGRFNYDYKGRYLAEFSFRRDGSSRFSPKARWGFFPAVQAGWRISEEPFMHQLISPQSLTNLKLRASYGKLGDDAPVQYQWVSGYNYPGTGAILGSSYVNGVSSRGVTNNDLTWLQSKTFDIGLDLDLWQGKLTGSFDYFVRNRDGLLATVGAQLPGTVGVSLPQQNLNSDQTSGVEIVLGHKNVIGAFGYNISGNLAISRTKNRFVEQTHASSAYDNYRNGQSNRYTNIWWGYQYAGQFSSYDEIYNYPINTVGGNQGVLPGDYYYEDINHDGVIDTKDQVPIATRDIPLINFGLNLGANWKGFDMNILFQGAANFHVQYAEQLATPLMYGRSALTEFLDRWHPQNPDANLFDPTTVWVPGNYPVTGHPVADENNPSTKGVQDASYVRVKTLEFGYSLPGKWLDKSGIGSFRIYVNCYNLLTFTNLENMDPEHPGAVANPSDGNQWNYSQGGYLYPENRTYSIGASISF